MNAVVTGLGVVAPNGTGVDAHWAAVLAGTSGIGPISRFEAGDYPVRLAGEVADFTAAERLPSRLVAQTDRWTQLSLYAAQAALADAGLSAEDLAGLDEYGLAVITASSSGGNEFGQREIADLWRHGPQRVSTYQSIAWFYAATTGQISIRHGMRGPCGVVVAEQAGGLDALAQAVSALRSGSRLVVTGGTEAPLSPYALVCQLSGGRLSHRDDPGSAYLPFDVDACGHIPGEGGAILIVEPEQEARERHAPQVYGRVAGHAATFDPPPGSGGRPTLYRAAELALQRAQITPEQVDVVFADAAAVPELDRAEAEAITRLFGPRGVPVTAPKTMLGRLYGGGAPLDLAAALLSIRDGVIPPTVGVRELAPACAGLDLVTETRPAPVRRALVLARGFGGFNSAVVVTAAA
ncbi:MULTISPECIES: ketosynthase chain-length factor [unclassified Nonomuraea]|uniref:ketosynthase chain-length factor n=1 Tax=unclassified Nonomuraea TaxID=2593643 RepID=UPI0033FA40DF